MYTLKDVEITEEMMGERLEIDDSSCYNYYSNCDSF